jgi:hypothetical protein
MPLQVIGAGFGRTGTLSMKAALEQLGLGPCYHMLELIQEPARAGHWQAALDGEAVDWEEVFTGFRSAVDWPAAHFWPQLAAAFPDAKIILTLRDEDKWYKSISSTIFQVMNSPREEVEPERMATRAMTRQLILDTVFGGNIDNRNAVLAAYRRNIEAVQRDVPADRLLVFDVAEGWAPLCRFLEKPVPEAPFPRSNSTEEFQQRILEN